MRAVAKQALSALNADKSANQIEEKIGYNPIDYSTLTFKNRSVWFNHTLLWIELLETEYMQNRLLESINLDKNYVIDIAPFLDTFYLDYKSTLTFIKYADDLCKQAFNCCFPEEFFIYTYAPNLGPLEDFLKYIISKKVVLDKRLFSPIFFFIAFSLSSIEKSLETPSSLMKRDMVFVAEFLMFLHKNPSFYSLVIDSVQSEEALQLLISQFIPKIRLYSLEWNETLAKECFERCKVPMAAYKANPAEAIRQYLSE